MRGRALVASAVLVVAAGCGDGEERAETASSPIGQGRIVIVDDGGEVVTMEPDGTDRRTLTDHGSSVLIWQPVPSPAGWVAWGEVGADGAAVSVAREGSVTRTPVASLPFYLSWSPTGGEVAVLHDDRRGALELEIIDVDAGAGRVAGSGAPFYFSWSPDGSAMLTHVGAHVVSVIAEDAVRVLDAGGGEFQAPMWTEQGLVYVLGDLLLQRTDPDADPVAVARLPGFVTAVASPDGRRIAVQSIDLGSAEVLASFQAAPVVPANRVVVLDVEAGTVTSASDQPAFGFFWSPDGEALLVLVAGSEEAQLEWRVWSESGPEVTTSFVPDESLVRDLLPFFDQYAQSWSPWAADSSAFAFTGRSGEGGSAGVWIQDRAGGQPRYLTGGSWVAWSSPR